MPNFTPATGSTQHLVGVCVNPIGMVQTKPANANVIFASRDLTNGNGQWKGVVAAALEVRKFDALLESICPINGKCSAHLVGTDGRIISRAPDPEHFRGMNVNVGGHYAHHVATGQKVSFHRLTTVTDYIEKISAVRTVGDGSYVVVVQMPVRDALAPWRAEALIDVAGAALLSFGVLALTWVAIRHHSREARARTLAETAQEKLGATEEQVRLLLDATAEGILGIDTHGRCIICNPAASKLLGYASPDDLIGQNNHELLHHHRADGSEYPVDLCRIHICAVEGTSAHVRDEVFFRQDGTSFPVEYHVNPIYRTGMIVGAVVWFSDITERLRMEDSLIDARIAAEAANKAKSTFLAVMSHELRTPLNSVLGFSELIRDMASGADGNQQIQEYADYIHTSGNHLLNLLNDILDLSKIESERMEISPEVMSIDAVISDCANLFSGRARKQGLSFNTELEFIDVPVWGDERAIRQIIFNALSNAIKFTECGGINVRMSIIDRDKDKLKISVDVKDTGIGIPKDQQKRLFMPFTQLANSTTRKFDGTGLGLVIAKRLVELMGGTIGIESEPGTGTHFWFTLPLCIAIKADTSASPMKTKPQVTTRHLRILVAEDNPINQMLVRSILRKAGHDIVVADNGRIALDAVASGSFDLVLMDMQMPEMDGEEATKRIRLMPPPKSGIPIIALTADAMIEHREVFLASGVNEVIAKPVDVNSLLGAIETYTKCYHGSSQ